MKQKNRAWIYCRIDAPEDAHGALKGQKKELMDYAEQMCFEVVGESKDLGNGLDIDGTGLLEVKEAAGEGKMDVLLVKKLDRIGPDVTKMLELIRGLEKLGVQTYSPLEGNIRVARFIELYADMLKSYR
jgi:DNA invertase Pin-like site-specific DNA recombinase